MSKVFLFLTIFSCLCLTAAQAQVTNMGPPKSWSLQELAPVHRHPMPPFDLEKQRAIDALNEASGDKLWRFGYEHRVDYGLTNAGTWTTLANGDRLWRIAFESADALTLNLVFDDYYLPEGASLYLYHPETKEWQGAYTSINNNADAMLGTTFIQGDKVVVEYYEPAVMQGEGRLNVSMVVHGYRLLGDYPLMQDAEDLNDAGACHYDVLCPLGIGWENQVNAVGLVIAGGVGACTGILINNTANDGTPYFLSAEHCGTQGLGAWVFRFNWDSPVPVCAQNNNSQDPGAPYNEINGAVLRANASASDFCLMELNQAPTGNVYYAGWDRSLNVPIEATCIHHPRGDVKKISRGDSVISTTLIGTGEHVWEVNSWNFGITEPASSGGPLFNQNKQVIGQLFGGASACIGLGNNGLEDYFGRLNESWDGTNPATRLRDWLDPIGSGAVTIDGYDPNSSPYAQDAGIATIRGIKSNYCGSNIIVPEVVLQNYGSQDLTNVELHYNIDGVSNLTYTWTGTLAPSTVTTIVLPSVTTTSGGHVFNVNTGFNGTADLNAGNDSLSFSFDVNVLGQEVLYSLATDCFGSETTWTLCDSATETLLYSGGPYNDIFTRDTIHNSFCLDGSCYRFAIYDNYGDGLNGDLSLNCNHSGDYWLQDIQGLNLVTMTAANGAFGDSAVHYFCMAAPNSTTQLFDSDAEIQIYPNPSQGQTHLELHLKKETDIVIYLYTATGQLLDQNHFNQIKDLQTTVPLEEYGAGLYYLQLKIGTAFYQKRIIKIP